MAFVISKFKLTDIMSENIVLPNELPDELPDELPELPLSIRTDLAYQAWIKYQRVSGQSYATVPSDCPVYSATSCATITVALIHIYYIILFQFNLFYKLKLII